MAWRFSDLGFTTVARSWVRPPEVNYLNGWNVRVPGCHSAVQAMSAMYELEARVRIRCISRYFNWRDWRSVNEASEDAQDAIMRRAELNVVIEDAVAPFALNWLNVVDSDVENSELGQRARARLKRANWEIGTRHARFTPPLVGEFVFNAAMLEPHGMADA